MIHQYKRAARELSKLCAVSGTQVERVATMLEVMAAEHEPIDS